jgi:UDP-N-acetylglucosamine 2-epimerase (non-hydrolysing)
VSGARPIRVTCVVGARPNFMKAAPLVDAMRARAPRFAVRLVHTGQHYDARLAGLFFEELGLPRPDVDLAVGSGSHARQTAEVMLRIEAEFTERRPDCAVVVGDVNSTLAAALAAAKEGVPVAHVEAGLRSFDRAMPEELNRIVTDQLADLLFVTEPAGVENLRREGVPEARVHLVGNVMIDTLEKHRARAAASDVLSRLELPDRGYAVVTLHRPANVDDAAVLERLVGALLAIAERVPIVFPVHPRTRARLAASDAGRRLAASSAARLTEPLGYLDFLRLLDRAALALTDSGGIQEETTALGVPCVTLRDNTERPITVSEGTNVLAGRDPEAIVALALGALARGASAAVRRPALWDGRAAERIVDVLEARFEAGRGARGAREE